MKKILLGVLLGFCLNSGLRTYYNWLWWSAEKKVTNAQLNKSIDDNGYPKIIYDTIGVQDNLKYLLISGNYNFQKWGLQFP